MHMYTFSVVLEFLNICNKYLQSPKAATLSCFRSSSRSIAKTRPLILLARNTSTTGGSVEYAATQIIDGMHRNYVSHDITETAIF